MYTHTHAMCVHVCVCDVYTLCTHARVCAHCINCSHLKWITSRCQSRGIGTVLRCCIITLVCGFSNAYATHVCVHMCTHVHTHVHTYDVRTCTHIVHVHVMYNKVNLHPRLRLGCKCECADHPWMYPGCKCDFSAFFPGCKPRSLGCKFTPIYTSR